MTANHKQTCFIPNSIFILFVMLFIQACYSFHEQETLLQAADSLMKLRPDSALFLLENMSLDKLPTPADQAKYALLLTQARDKNYITHTSDSLIRMAVAYYDSNRDKFLAAKAHYYWGRVCQDMGNSKGSAHEFTTALLLSDHNDGDILILLYSNLGKIFYNEGMYDKADSLYAEAIKTAKQYGDSARLISMYIMQGNINIAKGTGFYSEAEQKLKEALKIRSAGNNPVKESIYSSLSTLYSRMNRPQDAILFAKLAMKLQTDTTALYSHYLKLGDAYYKATEYDSAVFYLYRSLHSKDFYTRSGAYLRLSNIAQEQKKIEEALLYRKYSSCYMDSARSLEKPAEVLSVVKDTEIKHVTNKHQQFVSQYRYYIFSLCALLLLVIAGFIYKQKVYRNKVRRERKRVKRREEKIIKELKIKDAEIAHLRRMNSEHEDSKQQVNILLEQLLNKRSRLIEIIWVNSSVNKMITELINWNKENIDSQKVLSEEVWIELRNEVDRIFDLFVVRLSEQYPLLRKSDIEFCCLVKCGYKYADIAPLLRCSVNAIYKRRVLLVEKIDPELTTTDFDKFIQNF